MFSIYFGPSSTLLNMMALLLYTMAMNSAISLAWDFTLYLYTQDDCMVLTSSLGGHLLPLVRLLGDPVLLLLLDIEPGLGFHLDLVEVLLL